jgi:hypothetical protein
VLTYFILLRFFKHTNINWEILLSARHYKAKIPRPLVVELSTPAQPTLLIDRHSYYSEKIMDTATMPLYLTSNSLFKKKNNFIPSPSTLGYNWQYNYQHSFPGKLAFFLPWHFLWKFSNLPQIDLACSFRCYILYIERYKLSNTWS